jgi:hypothetical protein
MKLVRLKRTLAAIALLGATVLHAQDVLSPELNGVLAKAEAGDPLSQFRLGSAYDTGRGAPRDGKQAMRWYLAAAEQGYAEAQNSVGSGLQSEKRFAEALPWYERAAAQNHALATNNLAYLYDLGLGVVQDRQKAFTLYSRLPILGGQKQCGTLRTCTELASSVRLPIWWQRASGRCAPSRMPEQTSGGSSRK